jgi:mono/diheme cytochrome c family protein
MARPYGNLTAALLAIVCMAPAAMDAHGKAEPGRGDVAKGKMLFRKHCAGCHGKAGKGDGYKILGPNPADLTSPSTKQKSHAALLKILHEGKPNMPSWKLRLSDEDSLDVLAYVRTLAK